MAFAYADLIRNGLAPRPRLSMVAAVEGDHLILTCRHEGLRLPVDTIRGAEYIFDFPFEKLWGLEDVLILDLGELGDIPIPESTDGFGDLLSYLDKSPGHPVFRRELGGAA